LRSRADLILFGGRIITLDGAAHVAEAVAVDGERTTNEVIAPAQRLSRAEALRAATCAESGLRDITADLTIVGGRIVHERAQA